MSPYMKIQLQDNLVILTISFIQIKVVRELFQKPGFKFVVSIK